MSDATNKGLRQFMHDMLKTIEGLTGHPVENFDMSKSYNKTRRKEVEGKRYAYFKPRFERVEKNGKFNGYKYARKNDGNVSWTVLDPNALGRNLKQSKIQKYLALRRMLTACNVVDAIPFELGLSKADLLARKHELRAIKYGKGQFAQSKKKRIVAFDVVKGENKTDIYARSL